MIDEPHDLPFSPGFSARVLQQVDNIVRRRRVHGSVAAVAATVLVSAALFAGLRSAPPSPPLQASSPTMLAESDDTSVVTGPPTDPLAVMFPEAKPVARFAGQYASANGLADDRNTFAFPAEADENDDNQDL